MAQARDNRTRPMRSWWSGLAAGLAAALTISAAPARADEPVKIVVFGFELDDQSAAVTGQDAVDGENLRASTEEARRMLAASGRYSLIDPASRASELTASGGVRHCDGCEARFARALDADQSMAGIVTRVSRTEYTLQIVVRDAATGAILSNTFTGLRMGANYAWPRGVRWLMDNRILAAQRSD